MPDITTPTPGSGDKKPRKPRGPVDSAAVAQLEKDKEIVDAAIAEIAADPTLASAMASHFIDQLNSVPANSANLGALSQQAADILALAGAAVDKTATLRGVSTAEGADTTTAVAAIRDVQARAKEKYEETDPDRLGAYFVGQPVKSRAQITLAGTAIYGLLRTTDNDGNPIAPQDTLPGYSAAKIAQYKTDLGAFYQIQTTQSGAQQDASESREDFETQATQISRRRRKLQHGFDAERPHGAANTPLRRRLGLPTDKAMS